MRGPDSGYVLRKVCKSELMLMSTIVRSCFGLAPALLITASDWLTAMM